MEFKRQTYDNSYLFSIPGEMQKHHAHLTEFILKANRIEDKKDINFRGVIEDVKRAQKTSILYSVLMRRDVVLCYADVEMSAAFKVFYAKDIKDNKGGKVFIDLTGILTQKDDGYFVCNNPDKLVTYLYEAITWLVYNENPMAVMGNSSVTLPATECFVSLFDFIIGYFRFYGYNENRSKVLYLSSLYFLLKVLGKDNDMYTKQIAAKIAKVPATQIKAYDLYFDAEKDFANIDSFINFLANTFKFSGLTTEVFVSKWIYICGTGTQFAPELFTAFSNMMIAAYCGAFIVKQKTIEKVCGSEMIKFASAILKIGGSELDTRRVYESAEELDDRVARDKNTVALAEAVVNKRNTPDNAKFDKDDCKSKDKVIKKIENMIKWYISTEQETTLGNRAVTAAKTAIECMDKNREKDQYGDGVLTYIVSNTRKYMSKHNKDEVADAITEAIKVQTEYMKANRLTNKEFANKLSKQITELYKVKSLI